MDAWVDPTIFDWQDNSGLCDHKEGSLPFFRWVPSAKITDVSNIPTVAVHVKGGPLPDAFWIGDASVVSGRFKAIVEEFEPGVHQFFLVTLKRKNGDLYPGEYFIFHPTQYAPCVLLSKSGISEVIIVRHGAAKGLPSPQVHVDELVISRPAYGKRKIFGSIFSGGGLLVADEVMARIKAEKLTNLMVYPVKELDEPWVFEKEAPDLAAFLKEHPDVAVRYNLEAF